MGSEMCIRDRPNRFYRRRTRRQWHQRLQEAGNANGNGVSLHLWLALHCCCCCLTLLLLPDPAAVKALTGMATCNVKSPAMSALSSRACHLSDMHEVASSTGASHVGYVQKKHPLGNISRRALFWEFVSKSTLNRDNCLMFALVFHELNF